MADQLKSIEEIAAEVSSRRTGGGSPTMQKVALPTFKKDTNKIQDITYDVPHSAIYDRLNDGTYVAKFENYAGAIGNEDRLAREQTWYEQAGYGLLKNARKLGNYALDATVGTVAGVISSISSGTLDGFYDNEISKTLDDWNTQLDYKLPNYYSDEQKSKGILGSALTANFWFNDVAGGLAFVGGALLPDIAIAALTGGASAPGSIARIGLKGTLKGLAKEAVDPTNYLKEAKFINRLDDLGRIDKGADIIRGYQKSQFLKTSSDVLKTGVFLGRSSGFEAGMEARHNFKDAMDEYFMTFEDKNGRGPTFEEIQSFSKKAQDASNALFTSNLAILSISNAVMFGKVLNVKSPAILKRAENFGNRVIGLGTQRLDDATLAVAKSNRAQKILGSTYKLLEKPLVEGVYEEGLQGVASKTMQNYLKAQYDPNQDSSYGMWAALTDGFAQQYGSKEGWKEMGVGMIIGFAGGGFSSKASGGSFVGGLPGLGKNSRSAALKNLEGQVEDANKGVEALRNMNRAASMRNFKNLSEDKDSNFESTAVENSITNMQFIKTQEHLKTPSQIQDDFNTVIDNTELDDSTIASIGSENIDNYKETLKQEFKRSSDDYLFAKNSIESIGIEKKLVGTPLGDINQVKDALIANLYLGKQSLYAAKNVASQIQQITGQEGIFDSLEFYNGLTDSKKKSVADLRVKQRRLKALEEKAVEYGSRLAEQQYSQKGNPKEETLRKKYYSASEQLVITQQEIGRLSTDIENIQGALNDDIRAVGQNIDGTNALGTLTDISAVIDSIDQLDTYTESLRKVGKNYEADSLQYLSTQFKLYSDANKDMLNMSRRMFDSNFFTTYEGQKIVSDIVGQEYQMSDDMKQALRDNNEYIDRSLSLNGIEGYQNVEEYVQSVIEDNPNLSQREKYKVEDILRLQLGILKIQSKVQDINDTVVDIDPVVLKKRTPLEGDTVLLQESLNIQSSDLNNIDVLSDVISSILSQVDYIRSSAKQRIDIDNSADNLNTLNTSKNEFLSQGLEPEFQEGDYEALQNLSDKIRNGGIDENYLAYESTPEEMQLAANYPKMFERLIAGENNPIKDIDERINAITEDTQFSGDNIRIVDSEEYRRLSELITKKETEELTPQETNELDLLEQDVNQWLFVTGTIAEGLRLSDLIRQKSLLENTEINELPSVQDVLPQDVLDGVDFGDRTGNVNYMLGQTYYSVTAIRDPKTGKIAISGITPDAFIEEVGFEFDFEINERGNILVSDDVKNLINQGGNISVLPTNNDLVTNYSIVIKHGEDINGNVKSFPLKSDYNEDFSETQNVDAIYRQKAGDNLILEIDPRDEYNQELLSNYFGSFGTQGKSEEELNDIAVELADRLMREDLSLQTMKSEEERIKSQVINAQTTGLKASLNKELLKLQGKIDKREEKIIQQAEEQAYSPTPANQGKIEENFEALKKGAVIRIKDGEGNFLAVLKGKSSSGIKSPADLKFELLRDQVISQEGILEQISSTQLAEEIQIPGLKVKSVFIGHPNFNFVKNPDSSVSIEYKRMTQQDLKKVTDAGFVENGKIFTRSEAQGINTVFLKKFMRTSASNQKIPFVVIDKEGMKIGYPVRLDKLETPDNTELRSIFDSDATDTEKTVALNKILAQRGIDIKTPGNAFISVGEGNLNEDFLNEKIAQLEAIEYYNDPALWLDPNTNIQDVLLNQVSINIDLSNPVHSPKLQIDIDEVSVEISPEVITEENKRKVRDKSVEKSALHSILGRETSEEANDELNEDC